MPIKSREIVQAARWDLRSFFVKGIAPKFKLELGQRAMREHATYSGRGDKAILCFSKDFCSYEVSSIDDYNFVLMIISHEFAHYFHKHNEHKDVDSLDTKSIEAWADFFGAKIMMTLATFGENNIRICRELGFNFHSGDMLDSMSNALYRLAESLFDTEDTRYSNRITRVGYCAAGVTSFLDSYWKDFNFSRSLDVLGRLYSNETLSGWLTAESHDFSLDRDVIERVNKIHNKIQGYQLDITGGLKPEFIKYLGTSYKTTPKMRDLYLRTRREQAKRQGFDLPDF